MFVNPAAGSAGQDYTIGNVILLPLMTIIDGAYTGSPQETLDLALLARYFERFGDHAVGVSRRIVYLVTGDHSGDRSKI